MFTNDWNIKTFLKFYPEYNYLLNHEIFNDPEYIVRSLHDDDGILINIEVGFKEDPWRLPAPNRKGIWAR